MDLSLNLGSARETTFLIGFGTSLPATVSDFGFFMALFRGMFFGGVLFSGEPIGDMISKLEPKSVESSNVLADAVLSFPGIVIELEGAPSVLRVLWWELLVSDCFSSDSLGR